MKKEKMIAEENKITVGTRVKQIREALNIKGKDFAPRLKISGPSLSEIEIGENRKQLKNHNPFGANTRLKCSRPLGIKEINIQEIVSWGTDQSAMES